MAKTSVRLWIDEQDAAEMREQARAAGLGLSEWVTMACATGSPEGGQRVAPERAMRDETITLRVSRDEHEAIRAAASRARMGISSYLRSIAIGGGQRGEAPADRVGIAARAVDELMEMRAEAGRWGNNLNQAARRLNAGGSAGPAEADVAFAVGQINAIGKAAGEVWMACTMAINRLLDGVLGR